MERKCVVVRTSSKKRVGKFMSNMSALRLETLLNSGYIIIKETPILTTGEIEYILDESSDNLQIDYDKVLEQYDKWNKERASLNLDKFNLQKEMLRHKVKHEQLKEENEKLKKEKQESIKENYEEYVKMRDLVRNGNFTINSDPREKTESKCKRLGLSNQEIKRKFERLNENAIFDLFVNEKLSIRNCTRKRVVEILMFEVSQINELVLNIANGEIHIRTV